MATWVDGTSSPSLLLSSSSKYFFAYSRNPGSADPPTGASAAAACVGAAAEGALAAAGTIILAAGGTCLVAADADPAVESVGEGCATAAGSCKAAGAVGARVTCTAAIGCSFSMIITLQEDQRQDVEANEKHVGPTLQKSFPAVMMVLYGWIHGNAPFVHLNVNKRYL